MKNFLNMTFGEIFGKEKEAELLAIADRKTERAIAELRAEIKERTLKLEEIERELVNLEKGASKVKHKLLIDSKGFKKKPNAYIAAIQNRIHKFPVEVTIEELAKAIGAGKTFKTSYLTGKTKDTFVSSSLISLDIDNKGTELEKYGYKSIKDFIEDVAASEYKPAIIYKTFSDTEECNKYRAIFQLDTTVEDISELNVIAEKIRADYPYSDSKVSVTHCIYGGKEVVYVNSNEFVDTGIIDYSTDKKEENLYKTVNITKFDENFSITEENIFNNLKKIDLSNTVIDVEKSFFWINENIKLTDVLGLDINTKFRCIFQDHEDKHPSARIAETINGRQNYICSCTDSYLSLLDVLARILNMDKVEVQYLICELTGLTVGSEYQKRMRLLILDTKANITQMVESGTELHKEMKHLWGALSVIQDFASTKITTKSLSKNKARPTFYLSTTQLITEMRRLQMRGANNARSKIDQLKELGFIRALRDDEIEDSVLKASLAEKKKLQEMLNRPFLNRVEYFELCAITPKMLKDAEELIKKRKELNVKKTNMNMTRRVNAFDESFTARINVQNNVGKVYVGKKAEKVDKIFLAAKKLIETEGYFTYQSLRAAFDKNRTMKKAACFALIDDALPKIIKELNLLKTRVKNSTRRQFPIPSKVKTNTIMFCIK